MAATASSRYARATAVVLMVLVLAGVIAPVVTARTALADTANTIRVTTTGAYSGSDVNGEHGDVLDVALSSPRSVPLCSDCRGGSTIQLGSFGAGVEFIFTLTDRTRGQSFSSTDSTHAQIQHLAGGEWRIAWDDAGGDGDFNDLFTLVAPTGVLEAGGDLDPRESMGQNCAEKNLAAVQGQVGDPVNTATGNFNERFVDFEVTGRGFGLRFDHSYNSLAAGEDGPLGYGWTFSYGARLRFDETTGAATIRQESGAEVTLYPDGEGGFAAPPRVVASLTENADGTFTFRRCHDTQMRFGASGELLSVADRNGYLTSLAYGSAGELVSVTDASGHVLHVDWSGGRILTVRDESAPARSVSFVYDTDGNLVEYVDVAGGRWAFDYDTGHRIVRMRRPREAAAVEPRVVTNVYDVSGRVVSQTDELNRTTLLDYSSVPGATKVTDPAGNVTVERYENLVRTALTRGWGTPAEATWTFEVDPYTLGITAITDPNNRTRRFAYDVDGNLVSATDSMEHATSAAFTEFDMPASVTDANQVTTAFTYDSAGNVESVSRPWLDGGGHATAMATTTYSYEAGHPGQVSSLTDARGKVWSYAYDSTGNRTAMTDPTGRVTRFGYDPITGWLETIVSPEGVAAGTTGGCTPPATGCTRFEHDAAGRVVAVVDPLGERSTRVFDANGNVDVSTDPDGHSTDFVYDAADQLVSVARADGSVETRTYRGDGLVERVVDAAGQATLYDYDAQGRLSSETDATGRRHRYGYDPAGNLVSRADPGGACPAWPIAAPPVLSPADACTVYAYDAADRPVGVYYSDGITPDVTSISYDAMGRRLSASSSAGTSTWAWDSLGRLTASSDGAGSEVGYGYDLAGNVTSIVYPGAKTVTRHYDDAGRFDELTDWNGRSITFGYDDDANLTSSAYPTTVPSTDSYSFDDADRMSGAVFAGATITYGRDGDGLVTSTSQTGLPGAASDGYGYDSLDRLADHDTVPAWVYDAAGNLTARPGARQVFDAVNQLCWTSPAATTGTCATPPGDATVYGYDSRGNRVRAAAPGQAAVDYVYDQADRLRAVTAAGPAQGQFTATVPKTIAELGPGSSGTCVPSPCDRLAPRREVAVQIAGKEGIPTTGVAAVVLNVTGSGTTSDAALKVYPSNAAAPSTATLAVPSGSWRVNKAIVPLGPDGKVKLEADPSMGVTVSAVGWYSAAPGGGTSLYNPVTPAVVADTRNATRTGTCPVAACTTIPANATITVQVAGKGGIPAGGASAAALNFAVANNRSGWLRAGAGDKAERNTVIAFDSGEPKSGFGIVPLDANGRISVENVSNYPLDVVIEAQGWFAPPDGDGQDFIVKNPASRVLDTTKGTGLCATTCARIAAGTSLTVTVAGQGGVPASGVQVAALNVTGANGSRTVGYLSVTPGGTAPSGVAEVISQNGETTTNLVFAKLSADGKITLSATGASFDVGLDVEGWYQTAPPSVTTVADYAYNPDGLRVAKTVAATTTGFAWDKSAPIPLLLTETAGTATTAYLYGPGGVPVAQLNPDGSTWYLHTDHLGTIRAITDETGTTIGTATYSPYGTPTTTGATSHLGYTGQYTDPETGLIYLRARYYDPVTGQFLNRDPIEAITREPYAYAGNNPINNIDPSGLNWFSDRASDIGGAIAGGVDTAWDNTGGRAVSYGSDHAEGLGQISSFVAVVGYASCPLTAGVGCAVGGVASTAAAGFYTVNAVQACGSSGVISADCGFAALDAGLATAGAFAPNRFALSGRHFAEQTIWRSRALWNIGLGGVFSVFGGTIHSLLGGEDFFGMSRSPC